MAKQVSEILVKLGIQGFEGLDKLKGSFRDLEKAIGPTDSAIQTARQSIIDFAASGKQSIQSIQGQIEAFKGLQTQATIGSNVYRQLSGDVNRLSDTLKQLKNDYQEVGRAAAQTDAQIANQFPARRPEAFRIQLAALNRQLEQLSVSAIEYGNALTEITIRETAFGRAQARQGVIAGAQAVGAPLISQMQPQQALPNTTAALQLQIAELQSDLVNLDRTSEEYLSTARQISNLQEELSRNIVGTAASYDRLAAAENASIRRAEKLRDIQEYYRTQGPLAPGVGGFRDPATGAMIASGTRAGRQEVPIERPMREISGLYQQIGQIGMQPIIGDLEMMGNSYTRVSNDIKRATAASNGSIESLQAQRGAWQALRAQLNPASVDFQKASREIEQLDNRLGRLQQTQGRRMGGMQMAQAAGAAISGGIFGGPEGFLGGAIGGITGGVGGAFVGAAAGAQVGMLRQQLGGFADYASQIQKMEIALRNAAGSQDQFNQAMAAASVATRNLNVPQDVAIQGMTKLTAAVKGAGGQVTDAELVFKNVTSAIKATGGSAEDVDGAITAMVQVFSKGKVSAEELSGQLGERLPGAVTKFAKANDMTLPELQKALEQGQVGLNELMNFIVQLGDEYSGVAEQIAGSSQDAGARLTVAFNDMRIAIGETLQPVGAQFQEAFADFITNITPAVVAAAKAVGDGLKFIIDNASQIGAIVEFAAKLGAVTLALKALQAMQGPIAALFLALQNGFTASTAQAAAAQTQIIAFGTAVKAVAASLVAPIIITVAIAGAQVVINWLNKVKEAQDRVKKAATASRGESWVQEIGGSATDYATLKNQVQAAGDTYQYLADKIKAARQEIATTPFKPRREFLDQQIKADLAQMAVAQSRYRAGIEALGNRQPTRPALTQFASPTGDGGAAKADKAAEKAAREAERAKQEMLKQLKAAQDLNFEQRNRLDILRQEEPFAKAFTEFAVQRAEIQRRYNDLLKASKSDEERTNLEQARAAEYKQSSLELQKEINQLTDKAVAPINNVVEKIKERIKYDKEYSDLLKRGITPELAQQIIEIKKAYDESVKALEPAVKAAEAAVLRAEAEGASATEIKKYREELERIQKLPGQKKEEAEGDAEAEAERKRQEKEAADQAERLKVMYGSIVSTLEDGIVGSLMAGIEALIDGSKTLNEALQEIASGVLQDIGEILLSFAVNLGMRSLFPGAFAAKGAYFADGQANFAQNSIKPFAMGGIVTKPTFFKYADGGSFNNGVMGEAGPEAIMPLKRGPDGKLGVAAQLDGAMKRYRRPSGAGAAFAGNQGMSESIETMPSVGPIDVRYSVERINSVDYVTADQFQAGMQQAAAQGAIQGEQLAMRKLQQSASTRNRLGLK